MKSQLSKVHMHENNRIPIFVAYANTCGAFEQATGVFDQTVSGLGKMMTTEQMKGLAVEGHVGDGEVSSVQLEGGSEIMRTSPLLKK